MKCSICGSQTYYSGGCMGEWECDNPRCGESDNCNRETIREGMEKERGSKMSNKPFDYEQLKELKPSDDNPVVLERVQKCGNYEDVLIVKTAHICREGFIHYFYADGNGKGVMTPLTLKRFYCLKKKEKIVEFYEHFYIVSGDTKFLDENLRLYNLVTGKISDTPYKSDSVIKIPNGRTLLIDVENNKMIGFKVE